MTLPENEVKISVDAILDLKNHLNKFDYKILKNNYYFIYGDIEIIISFRGTVLISTISTFDLSNSISLISKLSNKINSIISVHSYSKKVYVNII
jgi:Holliday junction resolvase-like predicted endonuclease